MRKITETTATAFMNHTPMTQANTAVIVSDNEVCMTLHGHTIAKYDKTTKNLWFNSCGYQSQTTKERLNGILKVYGFINTNIIQRNGQWYIISEDDLCNTTKREFLDNVWVAI